MHCQKQAMNTEFVWSRALGEAVAKTHLQYTFLNFFPIKLEYTYGLLTEELFTHMHNVKQKETQRSNVITWHMPQDFNASFLT